MLLHITFGRYNIPTLGHGRLMQAMLADESAIALIVLSSGGGATTSFNERVQALLRIATLLKLDTTRLIFSRDNRPFELLKNMPPCIFFVGEDQGKFASNVSRQYEHIQHMLVPRDGQSSTRLRELYSAGNTKAIAELCLEDPKLIEQTMALLQQDQMAREVT